MNTIFWTDLATSDNEFDSKKVVVVIFTVRKTVKHILLVAVQLIFVSLIYLLK